MYEPSRHLDTFMIAGFQYWDGACALPKMRVGDLLRLVPEPDNPYDAEAVAIYRKGTKLGFVPRDRNHHLAVMCHFGHRKDFELRILRLDREADPWDQVMVGLYVKDARKDEKRGKHGRRG
ncbi:MAG: HIRAN domain-containing protein [Atopobiaceae bacterium]|jgi:hypothetical protein|nr:HIRAN domain-containing protein [Atopobiaceae bacterium]MCI2173785.1 HIRAN domain-containing protein [Atopobiaceae bacterium]MCI2207573.1 HIRAN domain-containing protein [Atopobiaceae bacterium]